MTKEARNAKTRIHAACFSAFGLAVSFVIGYFVIRHSKMHSFAKIFACEAKLLGDRE